MPLTISLTSAAWQHRVNDVTDLAATFRILIMALFETLVALMLVVLPILAAAHAFGLPYPTLLVAAGALIAAVPFAPRIDVDPKLALVLFVAPALLQSAYEASPRELYEHRVSLFMLAILAVGVTTAAVALLGCLAIGLPLATAVALGAIVAPPDAAASGVDFKESQCPTNVRPNRLVSSGTQSDE